MTFLKINVLCVLFAVVLLAQSLELGAEDRPSDDSFLFELEDLSSQEKRPFLLLGRPMQPNQPRWDEFREPVEKFASAQDCLNAPQVIGSRWNTLDVNWRVLTSHRDIEVCLFRIFDTIDDPLLVISWLERQGYDALDPRPTSGNGFSDVPPDLIQVMYVEAYVDTDLFEERVTFTRFVLPWTIKAKGYAIQIRFSNTNRLVSVFSKPQGR